MTQNTTSIIRIERDGDADLQFEGGKIGTGYHDGRTCTLYASGETDKLVAVVTDARTQTRRGRTPAGGLPTEVVCGGGRIEHAVGGEPREVLEALGYQRSVKEALEAAGLSVVVDPLDTEERENRHSRPHTDTYSYSEEL